MICDRRSVMPPVMMPDVPAFVSDFPVTVGVDDRENENHQPADNEENDRWFVPPHVADELGEIRNHPAATYTTMAENLVVRVVWQSHGSETNGLPLM